MTPTLAQALSTYNRKINQKAYAVAARLSDAERKAPRGAFFGSVHGTLNHILWGDLMWMSRFEALPSPGGGTSTEVEADFDALCRQRTALDARIARFTSSLSQERLDQPFSWTNTTGITRTVPFYLLVAHLFNHQTHHRGQLTTLFSQLGLDVGVTDLPFVLAEPE